MEPSARAAQDRPDMRPLPQPQARRSRRPPKSLAAVLAVVAAVGLVWALLVPPWQSPDEVAHFAYAQSLAENFELPGVKGRSQNSSDQSLADNAVGASRGAFYPESVPPDWSRADYDAYLALVRAHPPSRTDGSGPNPASANPPLYYLYADIAYLADYDGTAFGRLYAMRLWGILLLAATALGAWLLAGETLGRRRLPQLACAAVGGLMPMETFISTSVNPDALMVALWTFALWLGARVINRRAQRVDAVALCVVTAAAILTKGTSLALTVPVALALIVGWRRRPPVERAAALKNIAIAAAALVVPLVAWLGLTRALGRTAVNTIHPGPGATAFNVRQFISYVWQFYLPRLPFETPFTSSNGGITAYYVWLREGLGDFGWLDVTLPGWLYEACAGAAAVLAIGTIALLAPLRDRRKLALLAFFGLALIALLGGLHLTEYRSIIAQQGPLLQGRYLLPVVSLLGLSVGLVVSRLPLRARPSVCGLVLTGLLVLQTISLATVLGAYYL